MPFIVAPAQAGAQFDLSSRARAAMTFRLMDTGLRRYDGQSQSLHGRMLHKSNGMPHGPTECRESDVMLRKGKERWAVFMR